VSAAQHPIIDTVIEMLEPTEQGLELPEPGPIHDAVAAYVGKPELVNAVRALLLFAFFLEHRKAAPSAAATLLEVLAGFGDAVAAAGTGIEDVIGSIDADAAARRFLGLDADAEALSSDAPVMKWWQSRN